MWLWVVLLACGPEPSPPVADSGDTGVQTTVTATGAATDTGVDFRFTSDWDGVQDFIDEYCYGCHIAGEFGGFDFYERLDAEASGSVSGEPLVVPGDAEASLMWRVMQPDSPGLTLMPYGAFGPLAPEVNGHVRAWIEAGAPRP